MEPKRFGVRDLRNDTAAVLAEVERSGAVYLTRHGEVVAKIVPHRIPGESRTPMQQFLERVATRTPVDTGWADELADDKAAAIAAQTTKTWE